MRFSHFFTFNLHTNFGAYQNTLGVWNTRHHCKATEDTYGTKTKVKTSDGETEEFGI